MQSIRSNSTTISQKGKQSKEKSSNAPMQSAQLMKLFEGKMKSLYRAEKAVNNAIPNIIKNATSKKKKHLLEKYQKLLNQLMLKQQKKIPTLWLHLNQDAINLNESM